MSWRFRKTFKVLPGVKLNLTRHGLSATLGAAPFSVNVGPRGVYRNMSIPGAGVWNRERLDSPSHSEKGRAETDSFVPPSLPALTPTPVHSIRASAEIRSASTESLTSDSMESLRGLLKDAYDERDALAKEISTATAELNTSKYRYEKWVRGFLLKHIRKQAFAERKNAFETATAKLDELREQLRQTTLATEINIGPEHSEPYYKMRDDFASLSGSHCIWNVLSDQGIDRIKERSTSDSVVTRDRVSFSLNSCDLIQWGHKVPHLPNRTGGEMYVYPGFVLYRASQQAFALIDFRDVRLELINTYFTETGPIPSDSRVVRYTWAKANKDGTPDRRFHNNYQIPVVHYGTLAFSTSDGLDVRYLCSDPALAERFHAAWTAFRMCLTDGSDDSHRAATPQDNLDTAFESFKVAQAKFTEAITHPNDERTLRKDDFMAYMGIVEAWVASARSVAESPEFPQSAKSAALKGIRVFAASRSDFEQSVNRGAISGETLSAYFEALTAFVDTYLLVKTATR